MYVYDLIIGENDSQAISDFKANLVTCFHEKDLGSLKYFLGREVVRNREETFLC